MYHKSQISCQQASKNLYLVNILTINFISDNYIRLYIHLIEIILSINLSS